MKVLRCASLVLFCLEVPSGLSWMRAQEVTPGSAQASVAGRMTPLPYPTGDGTGLGMQISALLQDPAIERGHWGIAVTAMDGTPIFGVDEGKSFRPASTAKLFTTAAAMALLGPDAVVETKAEFPPPSADGVVAFVALRGAGDPDARPTCLEAEAARHNCEAAPAPPPVLDDLAAKVADAGVKRVTGDVNGDDSVWPDERYPEGWETDDLVWGYGAPVSALSVHENEVHVKVEAGPRADTAAKVSVSPETAYPSTRSFAVFTVAHGQRSAIRVARAPGAKDLAVYGTIAVGQSYETDISIEDPAEFAARAFRAKLIEHGIEVEGSARARHASDLDTQAFLKESRQAVDMASVRGGAPRNADTLSVTHASSSLAEDVIYTLKTSQNLHAELMLRRLGQRFGDLPTSVTDVNSPTAQGARVVHDWLVKAGISDDEFVFYDGSGLSTKDLVTPRAQAQLLAFAAKQPWFLRWKAALPVGGVDGTLASRFTEPPLKGHVFAKTGTLGESRALAGYVQCASGREVIFSILDDEHEPGSSADRLVMDRIVAAIAAAD